MNYNIFEFLRIIPHGKVMTYKKLAEVFGIKNGQRFIGKLLSTNKNPNLYPCYKIIHSDGTIGSYLGSISNTDKKINKLRNEKIYIKDNKILNIQNYLWEPKIHNIFIALDLDYNAKQQLCLIQKNIINEFIGIDKIINFQNYNTAHITLYFFDKYDISVLTKKLKEFNFIYLHTNLYFDKVDLFNNKNTNVLFFSTSISSVYDYINTIHLNIIKIFNVEKQHNPYIPHITIGRIKDNAAFNIIKPKLIKLLKKYKILVSSPTINIYFSVPEYKQFKLFI